jgi:hypothetical protein
LSLSHFKIQDIVVCWPCDTAVSVVVSLLPQCVFRLGIRDWRLEIGQLGDSLG